DAQRRQGSLLADRGGREVRLRELWTLAARWYAGHSTRDRRILAGIGALAALSLLYVSLVQPLIHYRKRVKTEIEEGQDQLEHSGELKPFAELVSGLEYGPQQLSIPFVELSRRGAVAGAKGPRTLQATVEVSGYLQGEQAAKVEPEPAEGEGEAGAGTAEGEAGAGAPAVEAPPGLPLESLLGAPPAPPAASAESPAASAESPAT